MSNYNRISTDFFKKKVLTTLGIILIYILGLNIQLPFIKATILENEVSQNLMFFMNAGVNSGTSLFAIGLGPWMISLIFWRLLSELFRDSFGRIPQKKQYNYQMIIVLVIAIIMSILRVNSFELSKDIIGNVFSVELIYFALITVMVAGTFLLIWFGNIISEKGIGGASSIILVNLILNLTRQISVLLAEHNWSFVLILIILIFFIGLTVIVVITEKSEFRVRVQQTVLYNTYADKLYIPVKLNSSGAMAIMYGLTIFSFITMLLQLIGLMPLFEWDTQNLLSKISLNHSIGLSVYTIILAALSYFFTVLNVNGTLLAKNMQKQGDYIDGIKFGVETKRYLNRIIRKISLIGMSQTLLVGAVPFWFSLKYPIIKEFAQLPSSMMVLIIIVLNLFTQVKHLNIRLEYSAMELLKEKRN